MPDDIAWWNKGTGMMSTVFGSTAAEISVIRTRLRGRRQESEAEVELCFWAEDRPSCTSRECLNEPEVVPID